MTQISTKNVNSVLVLGSNSFSGAWFCGYLLQQGIPVIGVSRSARPIDALCPDKLLTEATLPFHQLDINADFDALVNLLNQQKPSIVVNFAAQSMVGQSWDFPEHWYMTNCVSTAKLMNVLKNTDWLDRYVHISTPEVYGNCVGSIKEHRNYQPSTPYAISRAAGDMNLHALHQVFDFPVVFTRAANVYGQGQPLYRIIPRTMMSILKGEKLPLHGGGVSERSFIHMQDVAEATWQIALGGIIGDIYHIATRSSITIRQLVEQICTQMNYPFEKLCDVQEERLGKDQAYLLNSDKLRSELGWSDKIDLESGLQQSITWATQNVDALRTVQMDYIHKP